MDNFKNLMKKEGTTSFLASIMAIISGLLLGFIVLLISNPEQAVDGFLTILQGGFKDGASGIALSLYTAAPIIMTGLSVGFAFKTGLFNIGATGQFTMGAFVAIYIGVNWEFLGTMHWVVAILGAMVAGAFWGLIPGLLKAYFNVNEVITSIMLNYIGMFLVNLLVKETIFDMVRNQSLPVKKSAVLPKWFLEDLFPDTNANVGILIAIFFAILMYIILNKTVFGYELKACGKNPFATKYAGINSKMNIVLSMTIAGALSGVGGAIIYLSGSGRYIQVVDVLATEGFSGISVALLGLSNPIGIIFSGLFIAHITVGGTNVQLFNFAREVIDIIIAIIIYCAALSLLFKHIIARVQNKKSKKAVVETVQEIVPETPVIEEKTEDKGDK